MLVVRGRKEAHCCGRCKNFVFVEKGVNSDEYFNYLDNDKSVRTYDPDKITYYFAKRWCLCKREDQIRISLLGWCSCGFRNKCVCCFFSSLCHGFNLFSRDVWGDSLDM